MGTNIGYGRTRSGEREGKFVKPIYYSHVTCDAAGITVAQEKRIRQLLGLIERAGLHKYCEIPTGKSEASYCIKGLEEYCRRHRVYLLLKEGAHNAIEQQPHT